MKLGILSDTHNEIARTQAALSIFRARGVESVIHGGDMTIPEIIQLFDGWETAFVFGNIDRDKVALARAVSATAGPHHIGIAYQTTLNGWNIGVCHGHDNELLGAMIDSGAYHLVLHGHTHSPRDEQIGKTRVICPGALGGRCPELRSICVFDLTTQAAEFINVR